jgi:(S)-sulfolactate dehydrogenase
VTSSEGSSAAVEAVATAKVDDHVDVAVLEGVWGAALADLALRYRVRRIGNEEVATPAALTGIARQARCLVVRNRTVVDRGLLLAAPDLRVVARAGTGLDNIDLAAADDLGVVVVAAQGVNARSVAEMAIGLALGLARRIPELDRRVRAGEWDRRPGVELAGRTWGVFGLGRTGTETARLAAALGMNVVGHDPFVSPTDEDVRAAGLTIAALEVVRSTADILSLHIPLTAQTRGMVDDRFLARMRPGAFLINVARGGIVDEDALHRALTTGVIAGAALDVRSTEPPASSSLDELENLILTPHVAGLTTASSERISDTVAADIARLLDGGEARVAVGTARRVRP